MANELDNYNLEARKIAEKFTQNPDQIRSFARNVGLLVQDAVTNYRADKDMQSIVPTEKLAVESVMAKRDFKLDDKQAKELNSAIGEFAAKKINEKAGEAVIPTAYIKQNLQLEAEKITAQEANKTEQKQGAKKFISKTAKAAAS